MSTSSSNEDLEEVRRIVQKILIPTIFVIGLIGNSITVLVLTRKPMRCSTNVYLTALAIVDMLYLTMAFLLSIKHYESTRYYPIFWQCFGLITWLNDGFSYISIYIAVSFTIERYIAVRYPIRRQTFCTESLAKKVIAGIMIFCLATTVSTAFEVKITSDNTTICKSEIASNLNNTNNNSNIRNIRSGSSSSSSSNNFSNPESVLVGRHLEDLPIATTVNNESNLAQTLNSITNSTDCHEVFHYSYKQSNLGLDENYKSIFFIYTMIVFVVIPLGILITFNTFLIILVRKSKLRRSELTKLKIRESVRIRSSMKNKNSTISQENKITIILIAVVIVFIICQLPWSIFMILNEYIIMPRHLELIFGNIFNLLVMINAAANFFLYCVLSDKYRKTVKDLLMGLNKHKSKVSNKYGSPTNQSSIGESTTMVTSF